MGNLIAVRVAAIFLTLVVGSVYLYSRFSKPAESKEQATVDDPEPEFVAPRRVLSFDRIKTDDSACTTDEKILLASALRNAFMRRGVEYRPGSLDIEVLADCEHFDDNRTPTKVVVAVDAYIPRLSATASGTRYLWQLPYDDAAELAVDDLLKQYHKCKTSIMFCK